MARKVVVIGLGYIGLPTAVVLAESGWEVTGVDVSDRTIEYVSAGRLPFVEEGLADALKKVVENGSLKVQKETPKGNIFIISVPTPFKGDHELDSGAIDLATDALIPQLEGDELVILESTSPPGTTERMAQRVMDARPDLSVDGSNGRPIVHFAHAPERVLPGRIMIEMRANDRIVGGMTPEATKRAAEVYRSFTEGEVAETDARTAEMSKLTENAFRDVNIAFANELSLIADEQGIDVWELISLANRHPRVNILNPGPGVGGHCIAVDPWFIVSTSPFAKLIKQAREINDGKPDFVMGKLEEAVAQKKAEKGTATIALLGLAFKPNIDDLRESPAMAIAQRVAAEYPEDRVLVVEPFVPEIPAKIANFRNVEYVDAHTAVQQADVVVELVAHDQFKDLKGSIPDSVAVIDTTGLWR
ncbi:UDP-N-acetyl-D-mannosaminuronic acid dehydrogenase [Arcanobacterium wilhelmae]|uniref:UDP-N-acetyl-D-mannosaminuronic acid dehydrogenase n=1 Tax=Arcanobacterium wilhelmae TaxID=1803177 RepID=A0ABT9NE97_9ACTO|nr:UDP-N-acetyl-D-mannosamine dehydrogenase [Arcanobacterium wilhelmae]MDP9801706.1 UDP-N-acetyl-D-mannosaminuronic acid dehydrogenase [Arcanobacterium wilhelmae]WFN91025.1 UDP-N-acetyl-D-mannosamine dehydrogenase [Arcanobacterium wilhelmae]